MFQRGSLSLSHSFPFPSVHKSVVCVSVPPLQTGSSIPFFKIPYIHVSVQFSGSVASDSLGPHESQHTRPPCPSPSLRVHSNSCSSSIYALIYNVCFSLWLTLLCITGSRFIHLTQFSSVQSLSRVRLFGTPWIAAYQASLSITNSQSSHKLMCIELVMPSSHLILYRPFLLLPPITPSIRVFSNESTLCMRWPKYWSFSFSIIPSKLLQSCLTLWPHGLYPLFMEFSRQEYWSG